jgi:hypothetical protein
VDPVADIAVLAGPDYQALFDEAEAFESFIQGTAPLMLGTFPANSEGDAWLLTLSGEWSKCRIRGLDRNGGLWIIESEHNLQGGMSGSPIVSSEGAAIGVFSNSGGTGMDDDSHRAGGPQALLTSHLPAWLVRTLKRRRSRRSITVKEGIA